MGYDFGRLKFSIGSSVLNKNHPSVGARQSAHLQSLWERGAIRMGRISTRPPSAVHRLRSTATPHHDIEPW